LVKLVNVVNVVSLRGVVAANMGVVGANVF
jgi:hypothetical protein